MLLLAAPVFGLHIGASGVTTLPNNLPSKQGYLALQRTFPAQNPEPAEIVVEGGNARPSRPTSRSSRRRLAATPASAPARSSPRPEHISLLTVPVRGDAVSGPAVAAVRDLRNHVSRHLRRHRRTVFVGGKTAENADYFDAASNPTPYVLAFVLGLSLIVLTVAFRSLVVALVSILLNLLSVGAAYGLLTLVFLDGKGAGLLGFEHVHAIDAWVPLFLFSVLFGLSMDYQVFLMSRIKERYDQSGSTREAVDAASRRRRGSSPAPP